MYERTLPGLRVVYNDHVYDSITFIENLPLA